MEVKSLQKEPMIIPGDYAGLWSSNHVEILFHNGNKSHPITVNVGVRCVNCKCKITVDAEGWVYVKY